MPASLRASGPAVASLISRRPLLTCPCSARPSLTPLFQTGPPATVLTAKKSGWKDKDFKQYFAEAGEKNQNLFYSIKEYILSLGDDISENQLKLYVAFKKAKNVVCVEVDQNSLLLHLKLNPDTVDLIPGFVEDVRNKGHWGTGDLRVIIKSTEDFEKAQHLINRAYNEN